MERAAGRYPLELDFLESGRVDAPTRVAVTIRDRSGDAVLSATATGPIMLLALPEGRYTVAARKDGDNEVVRADVERGKHAKLAFDWKDCGTLAAGC